MKKRIVASFLLALMLVSLLMTTGCSKYIMTANGEKMKAGYYSFYVHWQRDYYKEILKGMNYDINSYIDSQYSETETVRQAIVSSAKSEYLAFVVVSKKFDELGLTLTEEQKKQIEAQYQEDWIKIYGEAGMKNVLKTLGLNKEEFLNLLAVEYKSDALLEYYYGENGQSPITEQDKKDYFAENYYRFKYVLLSTVDDDNKALPEDELNRKKTLANDLLIKIQNGESFEDLIPQYSEDYAKITDRMTAEEKKSAEESNASAVTDGIICDSDGIFNQTLHSLYNISVNPSIVSKLKTLEVGQGAVVDTETAIWVVKKYDLNEKDSYYTDRAETIYQKMYANDFNSMYTRWMAELDYKFDDEVLAELDPGTFTDLFSKVYDLTNESSAQN